MVIREFLELCGEAMEVDLIEDMTGAVTVVDTEPFITGEEADDDWVEDVVSHTIHGWSIKRGKLRIVY